MAEVSPRPPLWSHGLSYLCLCTAPHSAMLSPEREEAEVLLTCGWLCPGTGVDFRVSLWQPTGEVA